jgi:hypothetical protein
MRVLIGIAVALVAVPSMASAVASDQTGPVNAKLLELARKECATGEKSSLCDYVHQIDNARARQLGPGSTKAKAAAAQPPAPSKIPPLFNAPLYAPWLPEHNTVWCVPNKQGLFVRSDPLDNFHYLVDPANPGAGDSSTGSSSTPAAGSATGASINYTNDRVAGTQTATINGRVSYLIIGETPCNPPNSPREPFVYGFGLAPFVSSSGTWNEPLKTTSNSSVQVGADLQLAVSTFNLWPILDFNYFYASPYHQTDLRDIANINGVLFAWEPVSYQAFMDAAPKTNNPYFSFFWQLRAEAEILNVQNPGLTKLAKGDHDWLGETVRANLGLFPENDVIPWPDFIAGRLSVIGTAQNFYDTQSKKTANYYTAQLQYKLGPCKNQPATSTANVNACAIQGSSAVSLEYDEGTNKETFVFTKQYLVKFSYAY